MVVLMEAMYLNLMAIMFSDDDGGFDDRDGFVFAAVVFI